METFDSLVENQLNELMLGAVSRGISNKVGMGAANRLMAKMGSKTAKGQVTFQELVSKLFDDLKEFLGEQGVRKPVIDDVLDFLKYRVGFTASEEMMAKLAYGPAANAKTGQTDEIAKALEEFEHQIEYEKEVDPQLVQELLHYAQAGGSDEIQIRRGLHALLRSHPSQKNAFAPLGQFIGGKPIDTQGLTNLFSKVARMLLKVGPQSGQKRGNGSDERSGKGGERVAIGAGEAVNDDLAEDGEEGIPAKEAIEKKLVSNQLDTLGLPGDELFSIAKNYSHNPQALVKKLDGEFSSKMCAKLIRTILQLFVDGSRRKGLDGVIAKGVEAGDPDFGGFVNKVCDSMKQPYSKEKVNTMIYNKLRKEQDAAGFLARLILAVPAAFS